jgi:hypothetical protein
VASLQPSLLFSDDGTSRLSGNRERNATSSANCPLIRIAFVAIKHPSVWLCYVSSPAEDNCALLIGIVS